MKEQQYYKLFDLCVESNIDLNITPIEPCKSDVVIEVSPWQAAKVDDDEGEFKIDGLNHIMVDIHSMAQFFFHEGKHMHIIPHKKDYWENELVTYIIGVAFATLLLQRDVFSIHGSAFCANDLAYIIIGEAGAGKSSLAGECIRSGYKLLSDDLSAISTSHQLHVIPSYPTQKMWKDTLHAFEAKPDQNKQIFHNVDKFYVDIQDAFENDSKKLGGIIWLEPTEVEKVCLRKLNKTQALEILLIHAFIGEMVDELGLKAQQFLLLSHILNHVDVYHLQRPINQFTVKDQMELLQNKLINHNKM